ncbi:universal stress protein [Rhodocytophaga rosea]|uniref:Universal stress protein n=1 Tax=Rhodocytophaga rosea TaxID=2704465 RepID=A0A6C0GHY2_9BACT|nr:universal stress protein [Rhodocytophaga rosea]QHT67608.1 universal stress protein [Rhodocytophaga rosea]
MKTILVPTDCSKEAIHALETAVVIARQTGASVQLLHVIQTAYDREYNSGSSIPKDMKEKLDYAREEVFSKLENIIKPFREKDIQIAPYIKMGSVFQQVSEIITKEKIDMIVMGTGGASGLLELLDGSNTERVVRYANCLVLTVARKINDFKLRKTVLATNFKDIPKAFISKLNQLQDSFGFELQILYVNTPLDYQTTFAIEKRLEAFLDKHEFKNYTTHIVDHYSVEDGITAFAKKTGADIIAMATHGRTGLAHLLDGSVTENIVNHADRPVLTFHS